MSRVTPAPAQLLVLSADAFLKGFSPSMERREATFFFSPLYCAPLSQDFSS
jgi:hypothetical protein